MSAAKKMIGNRTTTQSGSKQPLPQQQSWQNARDDMLDAIPWWQIPNGDDREAFKDMLDNSSTTSVATKDSARTSISGSIYDNGSANLRKRRTKIYRSPITPSLPPSRSIRNKGYSFDKNYEIAQDGHDGPLNFRSCAKMHWDKYLTVKPLIKPSGKAFREPSPSDKPPKLRVRVHISRKKRRGQKQREVHAEAFSSRLDTRALDSR